MTIFRMYRRLFEQCPDRPHKSMSSVVSTVNIDARTSEKAFRRRSIGVKYAVCEAVDMPGSGELGDLQNFFVKSVRVVWSESNDFWAAG